MVWYTVSRNTGCWTMWIQFSVRHSFLSRQTALCMYRWLSMSEQHGLSTTGNTYIFFEEMFLIIKSLFEGGWRKGICDSIDWICYVSCGRNVSKGWNESKYIILVKKLGRRKVSRQTKKKLERCNNTWCPYLQVTKMFVFEIATLLYANLGEGSNVTKKKTGKPKHRTVRMSRKRK